MERDLCDAQEDHLPLRRTQEDGADGTARSEAAPSQQSPGKIHAVFAKKRSGPDDPGFISRKVTLEQVQYNIDKEAADVADFKQHLLQKYCDNTVKGLKGIHVLDFGPEEYRSYNHSEDIQHAFGNDEALSTIGSSKGRGLGSSADCPLVWMAFRHPTRSWL